MPELCVLARLPHLWPTLIISGPWFAIITGSPLKERLRVSDYRYAKHRFFPALLVWNTNITTESHLDYANHEYITMREATNQ